MEFSHDVPLCCVVKINHDIAAENQIERSHGAHAIAQVNRRKASHPAHLLIQLPVQAGTAEMLDQQRRRQSPVYLKLLVTGGLGAFHDL